MSAARALARASSLAGEAAASAYARQRAHLVAPLPHRAAARPLRGIPHAQLVPLYNARLSARTEAFILKAAPTAFARADPNSVQVCIATLIKRLGKRAACRVTARRRLRAAARAVLPEHACPRHAYLLIAEPAALHAPMSGLVSGLRGALKSVRLYA